MRRLAEVIEPPPLPHPVCRDPDDDQVLALAIAAKAEFIVSGIAICSLSAASKVF
jgi:predicted nucleic acid-binding protein